MAPFLPVRAVNRSQRVRIGKQTVKVGTTTYVDLASTVETGGIPAGSSLPYSPFKELQNHVAIGAVIVVGPITASNNDWVEVGTGGVTTATKEAEPKVATTAGEVNNRATNAYFAFPELAAKKIKVAAAGKERIDIVTVKEAGGSAPTITAGVAALKGAAVAPATPEKELLLATVKVTDVAEVATVTNVVVRA
jgi:hypothetical protein